MWTTCSRPTWRKIIMNLCESDEHQRTVAWYGTESQLKVKRGTRVIPVPQEFTTSSRICVICNDWGILPGAMPLC